MFDFNLLKTVVVTKFQSDGYKVATRFEEKATNILHFVAMKEKETIEIGVEVTESNYGISIKGAWAKEEAIYDFLETNIRMMIISNLKKLNKKEELPIWQHIEKNRDNLVSKLLLRYRAEGMVEEKEYSITTSLKSKYNTSKKTPIRRYIENYVLKELPITKKEIEVAVLYEVKTPKGVLYSALVLNYKKDMYLYNFFVQVYMGSTYILLGLEEDSETVLLG